MGEQGLQVAIDVGSGLIIVPWYAWNIERAESHRHLNIAPSVPKKEYNSPFKHCTNWDSDTYPTNLLRDLLHDFFRVSCVCRKE
jgi:hypothetical protein